MADPLTPEWWLQRLADKLAGQQTRLKRYEDYYSGEHPMPHVPPELDKRYLEQFRQLLRDSRANFMELVVDACAERLRVQGFRLSAEADDVADRESWRIWQANALDTESVRAFTDAQGKGRSYLSVWEGDDFPTIAVEDGRQVFVEHYPGDRRRRAAALKVWTDEWIDMQRANVYLPDGIYKFQRRGSMHAVPGDGWEPLADDEARFVRNRVGVVPIIPLVNRPQVSPLGQSAIAGVIPIQERINGTIFNRVLAGWFTAFRQRWATGLTIPKDPETNQPIEPFKVAIHRLWTSEDPEARFGEFGQTDLKPYLEAHERDIQDIAVITRTPRHYLFQSGQSPSGDAIKSAETGLVAKVRNAMQVLSDPLEETMRLARRFAGETDTPIDSEVIWADPEYRSEAMLADAVIKQYQAGVITLAMAQARLGYSPQEIERMRRDRMTESLEGAGVQLAELVTGEEAA